MRYSIIKGQRKKVILAAFLAFVLVTCCFLVYCVYFLPTYPRNKDIGDIQRVSLGTDFYRADDSWLLKNRYGLWEMYAAGNAVDRGNKIGLLSQELIVKQEDAFVDYIENLVSSKFLFKLFRICVGFYNRNLGNYIPEENKEEIYAVSRYASRKYEWMGNNYQRMMSHHSVHDIGKAVQLSGFAGCSALAVWGDRTLDGTLLVGRNFDFYAGNKFAEDKILLFVNPANGYKHAFVTWGGMMGAVSGMNEKGLCVVLNSAPSDIPFSSTTPVSILARRILQYAGNIEEAVSLSEACKISISEQFIIASAEDNRAVIIEKTKKTQEIYSTSMPYMLCANHFQSRKLLRTKKDNKTSSIYRMDRMYELLDSIKLFTPRDMVAFLRDKSGKNGTNIGLGNESSINQLIAHHSVVFHPDSKTVWVSTFPYQEGAFLAYNLNKVFDDALNPKVNGSSIDDLMIPADHDFISNKMIRYNFYRYSINTPVESFKRDIQLFIDSNPENYKTYEYLGDYYSHNNIMDKAREYYELSLQKMIPDENKLSKISGKLNRIKNRIKN
jgi:predicted choloylglycine hydrolase